jgi:hypothetical protein
MFSHDGESLSLPHSWDIFIPFKSTQSETPITRVRLLSSDHHDTMTALLFAGWSGKKQPGHTGNVNTVLILSASLMYAIAFLHHVKL